MKNYELDELASGAVHQVIRSVALAIGLLVLVVGCRTDRATGPATTQATDLRMGPTSVSLTPGDTAQLEATPVDKSGKPVPGYEVTWSISDTAVATVDGDGTVTGESAGSTTVTATASKGKGSSSISASVQANQGKGNGSDNDKGKKKGLKKQADVTVTESGLITSLEPASYEKDTLEAGDSVYIDKSYSIDSAPPEYQGWVYVRTASDDATSAVDSAVSFTLTDTARLALAYDIRATTLPDWLRNWTATGDTLHTTNVAYLIYSRRYLPGEAVLGGNLSGGAEGAESMYVLAASRSSFSPTDTTSSAVDSVNVTPDSAATTVGGNEQFSAAVYDSAGNELSRPVAWTSSDTTVATVDSSGLATGRDSGFAHIIGSADGVTDSAYLVVDTTSGSGSDTTTADASPVFADGFESGAKASSENGYEWGFITREGKGSGVTSDHAHSGSYSLRIHFPGGGTTDDQTAYADLNFPNATGPDGTEPGPRELWIEYYYRIPDNFNYEESGGADNNKWFQVWSGDRSDADMHLTGTIWPGESSSETGYADATWARGHDSPNSGKGHITIEKNHITPSDHGTWVHMQWHIKTSSGPDQNDGVIQVKKNGVTIYSDTSLYDLYDEDNIAENTQWEHLRFFGWANAGYPELTEWYIDDLKIYQSDPGW